MGKKYCIFGFDSIDGYDANLKISNENNFSIVEYMSNQSIEEYDGVIIPQGVFEEARESEVKFDYDLLLKRESEVVKLLRKGGWVCFLVDTVQKYTRDNYYNVNRPIGKTDLFRNIMHDENINFDIGRSSSRLNHSANEFSKYTEISSVGKTEYSLTNSNAKPIIQDNNLVYGFELYESIFALPSQFYRYEDSVHLEKLIYIASASIENYRRKNKLSLPKWLDNRKFKAEDLITNEIDKLQNELAMLKDKYEKLKKYKAILTTSGDKLRLLLGEILENYFGLCIDMEDTGVEDLKIIEPSGDIKYFVEVKGTNKGLKREHVNQLDSHRERAGISYKTKGILFINQNMKTDGYELREKCDFDQEQIEKAISSNVVIVRAIDLFNLMIDIEDSKDKGKSFINWIENTKGWQKYS